MKFTIDIILAVLFFAAGKVHAQAQGQKTAPAPVSESKFFCKVEEFGSKKEPVKAKRCAKLVEAADEPVKSAESCKEHGLAKGEECLKLSGSEQVQVKIKFTEQFGANKNFSMWTCELDNKGGSACP